MLESVFCPICGEGTWREIGARVYRSEESSVLKPYVKKRYRVLFEVWFPGKNEVVITSQLCKTCGFVLYTPRPSEEDIDAKYRFLSTLEPDDNAQKDNVAINNRRARLIYNHVKKLLPKGRVPRILDFGGGDGRLMRDFIAQGCECYLVDYSEQVVPGVRRIGTTIEDIPPDATFDLIICSHVIEHVANPLKVIILLKQHLEQHGAIFIEVPMEIWGRAPLPEEPVTHVNFFTPVSLLQLMEKAEIAVTGCRMGGMPHNNGRMELVIRAIGKPCVEKMQRPAVGDVGMKEAARLLNPTVRMKLMRYLIMPSMIPRAIAYKICRMVKPGQ